MAAVMTRQRVGENGVQKHGHRYPWELWFRRGTFPLRRGKHYAHLTFSMAQMVRKAARTRGLRVTIRTDPDGEGMRVTVVAQAE